MGKLILHVCGQCGQEYGLLDDTMAMLRRSGQTFYCPWGHARHFAAVPSSEDKLRQEHDRLKQENARLADEARAAERRASAAKGQVTRLKNRAAAGVCPCCNRTFAQLQRHMAAKHPNFTAEDVPLMKLFEDSQALVAKHRTALNAALGASQ